LEEQKPAGMSRLLKIWHSVRRKNSFSARSWCIICAFAHFRNFAKCFRNLQY